MKIIIGVTGSIAAYKAANLVSLFKKKDYDVHVVMTKSATKFINPITFEVLSQNKVFVDMFKDDDHTKVEHINLTKGASAMLIAPASFNVIGKVANGIADDMLTTMVSAYPGKVFFAPAMNTNMYENPIFEKNKKTLEKFGYQFITPAEGLLACGDVGNGKLQDENLILATIDNSLNIPKLLNGKKVLVTAGATREYIDPIRFITNTSSGKMGSSLASAAQQLGAEVTLITGATPLPPIEGVKMITSHTSEDMKNAVLDYYDDTDVVIMSAAVGDYRPKVKHQGKMKKQDGNLSLELERTTDILKLLGEKKKHQMLIGFAAESDNLVQYGKEKLKKKNLDYIVINDISNFASETNSVILLSKSGTSWEYDGPKPTLAFRILESIFE
ncbi:bifunctional phosphopantothenoylcysteine decarboxylase/phosphopantothenate--cysteine ligase CoaBC [Balneicella halophila]|nr:bifunctional phosphopantothenoylcysteine decarboxylase/phosphopantothenate--cysteine ligase CoaBC [Balneicella halophila]